MMESSSQIESARQKITKDIEEYRRQRAEEENKLYEEDKEDEETMVPWSPMISEPTDWRTMNGPRTSGKLRIN